MERIFTIDPDKIITSQSISRDCIKFPYRWEETTEQERENIAVLVSDIVEHTPALRKQQITDIAASVSLHPGEWRIFTTLSVTIVTASGKEYPRSVGAEMDIAQAKSIVKAFIDAGLPGLSEWHACRIVKSFDRYLKAERRSEERCAKADRMIALLKAGKSVDDVLAAMNAE